MVDKNSPQYADYLKECETMAAELDEREQEIVERLMKEKWRGRDNKEISDLRHELSRRLKEIQKKYGFD